MNIEVHCSLLKVLLAVYREVHLEVININKYPFKAKKKFVVGGTNQKYNIAQVKIFDF